MQQIDAEMQRTGVLSTCQGTGQHSKEQRLVSRMYGCHFSSPEDAPRGCVFAGRLFAVNLARYAFADGAPRVCLYELARSVRLIVLTT